MSDIDLKKLDVSIEYIKRMAEGRNPINNEPIEGESVLHNPNVIRCFYFVEDVLKQVRTANGAIGVSAKKNLKRFPLEHLQRYSYKEDRSISRFVDQLNEGLDAESYKKLGYTSITRWLKAAGYLVEVERVEENKKHSLPSDKGRALGIYTEERESQYGRPYLLVLYNKNAQEFIVNNMDKILDGIAE